MNIQFSVQTDAPVQPPIKTPTTVEIIYAQSVVPVEGETNDPVLQSVRLELDTQLHGSVQLTDAALPQITARVLAADGSSLISRMIAAEHDKAVLMLVAADVVLIRQGGQRIPTDTAPVAVMRTARLMPLGTVKVNYSRSNVVVVAIKDAQSLDPSGVSTLLNTSGGTLIASIEVTSQSLNALAQLPWRPTHLAVDGTFTAAFLRQPSLGWVWWLTGEPQVLGFMPDDLQNPDNRTFMVPLPPFSASPAKTGPVTPDVYQGRTRRVVPANVNEKELAENPDIYTEDPGAFCKPFSNPERVLSEKSFAVIARITMPEISPLASAKSKTITITNLDEDASASSSGTSTARRIFSRFGSGSASSPAALTRMMTPVRHNLVSGYIDLLRRLPSARLSMDANHPLQWEDDIAQYQAVSIAVGHVLEFRIRWRSNGYSLGTVAKTLTLAPRQTKRIQKIEWQRSERALRSERSQLIDRENDATVRERDYQDTVAASLSEWSSGSSSSDTEAVAGGIGFFAESVLGGVGGGAASAHSSSQQQGGRDATASEHQRLRDAIRRHGDALRKFESTVVNEVTQEETVTGTTEVIRNANYVHSLTVIYYQILRHLRVDTEFAGVRECLFVPFAIKPFDVQRAYRWREAIQARIRSPRYGRALRYLKDVINNFATSDIPPGPRAQQRLTFVRGSVYVSLGVERPRDTSDGQFDSVAWSRLQPFLTSPALGIVGAIQEFSTAVRDRVFQTEYAPSIAAEWTNGLTLKLGPRTVLTDFTLASRYQYNRVVRIDYSVPSSELGGLTREAVTQITISHVAGLPPGSVANLKRATVTYSTERFERTVEGRTGTNDLVNPTSGAPDPAIFSVPLEPWERVDERAEIVRSVQELVEHLNEHVEYYHKAIWWRMDRDRLMMLLDGFYVPNTNDVSIASVVDREPLGVIGNCLVYRIGAASFLGYGKVTTPAELYNVYAEKEPISDPVFLSLPTDGLYAQAIMDECVALEEHFGNLDWVLNDKDPDLGSIDPSLMLTRRTDQTSATTPTAFPSTIISLQNAPEAPAPSGPQGVLNAVTNPNAFRDMAGLAGTQANAQAGLSTAANLATNFGNQAAALELAKLAKAQEATRTADQKIASIKGAVDKGLATPATANEATKNVLSAMNPDSPKTEAPHENAAINSAIDTAKRIPGSTIEATTGEGGVKVKVGGETEGLDDTRARPVIILPTNTNSAENRAFNPSTRDISGTIDLEAAMQHAPVGSSIEWSASDPAAVTVVSPNNLRTPVQGLRPGRTQVDCILRDASGTQVASAKIQLCVPQFIRVTEDAAKFNGTLTALKLNALKDEIVREARATCDHVLSTSNARTVWQVGPFAEVLPAHLPAANMTVLTIQGDPPAATPTRLGQTNFVGGVYGAAVPNETIDIFPGAYDNPPVGNPLSEMNAATEALITQLQSQVGSDPVLDAFAVTVYGRLIGETIAHEITHSLLGKDVPPDGHNVPPIPNDLMNSGADRDFQQRTGWEDTAGVSPLDPANFVDHGIAAISGLQATNQARMNRHFPVPPSFA